MGGTVAEVMSPDFVFVDSNATVAEAEEHFEQGNLQALPVLNPDRTVFGLLTPQNLAHFHRRPLNNPRAFHAWEICDARPTVTSPETPLEEIAEAVLSASGRPLMVVNEARELVGVINSELLLRQFVLPDQLAVPANRSRSNGNNARSRPRAGK